MGWLKATDFGLLTVLEAISLKSGCRQGHAPPPFSPPWEESRLRLRLLEIQVLLPVAASFHLCLRLHTVSSSEHLNLKSPSAFLL